MKKIIFIIIMLFTFILISCNSVKKEETNIIVEEETQEKLISESQGDIIDKTISSEVVDTEEPISGKTPTNVEETIIQTEPKEETTEPKLRFAVPYVVNVRSLQEFKVFLEHFKVGDYKIVALDLDSTSFFGRKEYEFFGETGENYRVYEGDETLFNKGVFFYFLYMFYSIDDTFYQGFNENDGVNHYKVTCRYYPIEFDITEEVTFELVEDNNLDKTYNMYIGDVKALEIYIKFGKYGDTSVVEDILNEIKRILIYIE